MTGFEDSTFKPSDGATRVQIASIMTRFDVEEAVGNIIDFVFSEGVVPVT